MFLLVQDPVPDPVSAITTLGVKGLLDWQQSEGVSVQSVLSSKKEGKDSLNLISWSREG